MDNNDKNLKIEQSGFTDDGNGLLYANIDGFLYTLYGKKNRLVLAVNLPALNKNERGMISCYIKESAVQLDGKKFTRDGLYMYFDREIVKGEDYIHEFARQLSAFLISVGIEFSNPELNISLHKKMYVFKPIAAPIDDAAPPESEPDELPNLENAGKFKCFMLSNMGVPVLLAVCAVLYFILLVCYVKIAAAVGYVAGWLVCYLLTEQKKKHLFLLSVAYSSIMLIVSGIAAFLVMFLSQTEIYSIFDFFTRSLAFYHCLFSTGLGIVLALFGIYSTIPPKSSAKKAVPEDF